MRIPWTVWTLENVEHIKQALKQHPDCSAWRHSTKLSIGNQLVRYILHEDLHYHQYKLVFVQQLKPWDYAQLLNLTCQRETIFGPMCHKVHFHHNSMRNQQDCHYWVLENLRELHEWPLHKPKVCIYVYDHMYMYFYLVENCINTHMHAHVCVCIVEERKIGEIKFLVPCS